MPNGNIETNYPFRTVLVARQTNEVPSELEIVLRQWTHRLRVVNELSGKSHLLLIAKETIAVRAYFPNDIDQFEKDYTKQDDSNKQNYSGLRLEKSSIQYSKDVTRDNEQQMSESRKKFDSLNKEKIRAESSEFTILTNKCEDFINDDNYFTIFRESFKYSIVFFVLPPGKMHLDQLSRPNSFVMRAQRALLPYYESDIKKAKYTQVFIVPDVQSILRTLLSITETIQPGKMNLKQDYLNSCAGNNGISSYKDIFDTNKRLLSPPSVLEQKFASQIVAKAFRDWSVRFEIPIQDVSFLLSALGNIESIVSRCNNDFDNLEHLPIANQSKTVLYNFFGSKNNCYRGGERNQKKCKVENHCHYLQQRNNLKTSNISSQGEQNQGHTQPNEQYKTLRQVKRNSSLNNANLDVDEKDFAQYTTPEASANSQHIPPLSSASSFKQRTSNPSMEDLYGNLQQHQYEQHHNYQQQPQPQGLRYLNSQSSPYSFNDDHH